jgi:hypothetical protein
MDQVVKEWREKWVIIPLEVERSQLVQIDYWMPSNVFHCTGVFASVYGVKGYYLPTRFGEVSLQFNNRASHPVHLPGNFVPYRTRLDQILCKMEEPVTGNTRITGYFRNILEFPYNVQIYLQCLSLIKTTSQT